MVEAGKAATPFKLNAVFSNLPSEEDQIACANTLTLEKTGLQKWARETPASEAQLRAFSDAREAWEATSQRASLRSELTAISDQHRIKNIVCNALGTLFTEDQSDFEPRDGGIHAAPPGLFHVEIPRREALATWQPCRASRDRGIRSGIYHIGSSIPRTASSAHHHSLRSSPLSCHHARDSGRLHQPSRLRSSLQRFEETRSVIERDGLVGLMYGPRKLVT
ncbi:hypothetical protein PMIN04_008272 [Paraphaeosphaeria minitans]